MAGVDLTLLLCLFTIFVYVFIKNVITAQYKVYLLFHFFMMIWPIGQVCAQMTDRPQLQIIYITLSFVGLSMLGFGWLLFTRFLVSGPKFRSGSSFILFTLVPSLLLAVMMIWNPGNLFVDQYKDDFGKRQFGPIFWVMIVVLLSQLTYSVYLLRRELASPVGQVERGRLMNALIGVVILASLPLLDLVLNVVLGKRMPIVPGLTSLGIVVSDIYFLFSLQKHRSFDLVTVAQQDVVNTLSVGIIVLDQRDIVIEINRNISAKLEIKLGRRLDMESFLHVHAVDGRAAETFLLKYRSQSKERIHTEIAVSVGPEEKQFLSLHAAPIRVGDSLKGKVITLQDITELKLLVLKSQEHNNSLQERNRALIYMQDELFQANRKLEQMAITDSLTGCFNRRFLMQQLEHEVLTNLRYKIPFALFLFDIDLFKLVNDTYGHMVGDEVIRKTAEVVKGALRRTDILARYGGEEFAVYLPHTNNEQAEVLAQRIREVVESNEIPAGRGTGTISVTISMGMHAVEAQSDLQVEDVKKYLVDLFSKIDKALYRAKDNGRNRVVNH